MGVKTPTVAGAGVGEAVELAGISLQDHDADLCKVLEMEMEMGM